MDLAALADRIAIEERLFRYAHLLDTGRFDQVADAIFTEDADIDLGGDRLVGRAAIQARLIEHSHGIRGCAHVISNLVVAIDGDAASACAKVAAWHWFARPDADPLAPADLLSLGGYEDRLRRTPEGWRVCRRRGFSAGSGIGVGMVPAALRPMFESMLGRTPEWPA